MNEISEEPLWLGSFAIRAYAMSAVGKDVVSDHKGREHC